MAVSSRAAYFAPSATELRGVFHQLAQDILVQLEE